MTEIDALVDEVVDVIAIDGTKKKDLTEELLKIL